MKNRHHKKVPPVLLPGHISFGTRDPTVQPFAANSSWNLGIGSNATWGTATDADNVSLVSGFVTINAGNFGMPFFVGTSTDPLVTFTCTDNLFPIAPQHIHVPAGSVPSTPSFSAGGDAHMNLFDLTQPTRMWSYWGCRGSTASGFTAGLGMVCTICDTDIIDEYNFGIGTIRTADISAGVIPHMLRFSIGESQTKSPGGTWTSNIPWPASREDFNGPSTYTGNFVYGSTVGIPASVNLAALGLTTEGLMLATALQKYGAIQRDTIGSSVGLVFYAEPGMESSTAVSHMRSDLATIKTHLRVMRNQSASTPNGGGTYPARADNFTNVSCP